MTRIFETEYDATEYLKHILNPKSKIHLPFIMHKSGYIASYKNKLTLHFNRRVVEEVFYKSKKMMIIIIG